MSTTSPEAFVGRDILKLVQEQVDLGPRVPGTGPHDALARLLEKRLADQGAEVTVQEFPVEFQGAVLHCRNIVGVFRATVAEPLPPLLLGTHFDTRMRADREENPALRERPITGANDGGSGTAVFLHMLPRLAQMELSRDVAVAFFDAEDLGNIDGKDFAIGADWFACHPLDAVSPAEALILDMVGGKGMVFDIDAHMLTHLPSRKLTTEVFGMGMRQGWEPFVRSKKNRLKYIISDHTPFARRGIPACILIDIDYPQWHMQADLPDAMSGESLGVTEAALWLFLTGRRTADLRSSPGS